MSSSITLSPSTPFLKASSRKHHHHHPLQYSNPNRLSLNKSQDLTTTTPIFHGSSSSSSSSSYPRSSSPLLCASSSSSSSSTWNNNNVPSLLSSDHHHHHHHGFNNNKKDFKIQATPVPDSAGESEAEKSTKLMQTLQLGSLFGLWYLFNIYFNIYNKQTLKVFPFPVTITTFQFVVGTAVVLTMWTLNLHKRPKITTAQLVAILPLAIVHTMGNLFTNMSLGKVAVSFTHTIKAMEPFFSVLLSSMFLGEMPTLWVVSSLLPIVGGVALASMTESSFNWAGFWSAMASNVTFQSRNVLSKKFMVKKEASLDNITLFSIITIMSLFLLAPVALFVEGVKFTPAYLQGAGLNVKEFGTRALLAGFCFHAYQQVSYMILQRVSPVTHSVGNCVKRVVVIVTSVLFFRTPVSPINSLGTGIALAGVFLYSRVKGIKPKAKEA